MTTPGEYLKDSDVNGDGRADWEDVQAHNRRLDQEDTARALAGMRAAIAQGVRNIGASFAGLWRNVTALTGKVRERVARTKVRLIVETIPEEARDADTVYAWCFPSPYRTTDHEQYRRWFVAIAFNAIKPKSADIAGTSTLQVADVLAMLADYGDEPLQRLVQSAYRRQRAPTTKPVTTAEPASVPLGFVGAPAAAAMFTPVTQVLAALLTLAVMFGLWKDGQAKNAARYRDALEQERIVNAGLGKRVVSAEEAVQDLARERDDAIKQADARIAEMQREVERARLARTEKRIKDAQAETRSGGDLGDDREWLRRAVEPASDTGGNAAPADADPAASDSVSVPPRAGD